MSAINPTSLLVLEAPVMPVEKKEHPLTRLFKKIFYTSTKPLESHGFSLKVGGEIKDEIQSSESIAHTVSTPKQSLHLSSLEVVSASSFEKGVIEEVFGLIDVKQKGQNFIKSCRESDSIGNSKAFLKFFKSLMGLFSKATKVLSDGYNAFASQSLSTKTLQMVSVAGFAGSSAASVAMLGVCSLGLGFHLNEAKSSLANLKASECEETTDERFSKLKDKTTINRDAERSILEKTVKNTKLLHEFQSKMLDGRLTETHPLSEESKLLIQELASQATHLSEMGKKFYIELLTAAVSSEMAKEQLKITQKFHRAYGKEILAEVLSNPTSQEAKNAILEKARKSLLKNIAYSFFYMTGALIAGACLILGKLSLGGTASLAESILALIVFTCTLALDLKKTFDSILKGNLSLKDKIIEVSKKLLFIFLGLAAFIIARTGADVIFSSVLAITWGLLLLYTLGSLIFIAAQKK